MPMPHMLTCAHAYMRAPSHSRTVAHSHTDAQDHTRSHTLAHSHTHTHTHTVITRPSPIPLAASACSITRGVALVRASATKPLRRALCPPPLSKSQFCAFIEWCCACMRRCFAAAVATWRCRCSRWLQMKAVRPRATVSIAACAGPVASQSPL